MGVLQQLWLDLWGGAASTGEKNQSKTHKTPVIKAHTAIKKESPGELLPSHPDANRALALGPGRVAYLLVRSRRRSIGFTVGLDGLVVRAPAWVGAAQLDAALHEKADWIVRQLARMHERVRALDAARPAWCDGGQLPYFGQPLTLRLGAVQELLVQVDGHHELRLALPPHAAPDALRAHAQRWFIACAREHLELRLEHFAPLLAVRYQRWQLSNASTRWGSASASGVIRLNWRLLHYPREVIDYVVVHELAHLRVMDHSPSFWAIVESVCPEHRRLRRALREQPAPAWQ